MKYLLVGFFQVLFLSEGLDLIRNFDLLPDKKLLEPFRLE